MSNKGPFGLWMGMTLEEVGTSLEQVAPGKYITATVPRPHSAFENYVLQIAPRCGLSWIKAIGKTIPTSVFGLELRSAFDAMETKLDASYGRHSRTDVLLPGSIWNEPGDWMQSFLQRERVLMSQWAPEHKSALKDSIMSVGLILCVADSTSGYICIEYSFENGGASDAELAKLEDDVL